ncbi:MAG: PDZ domain-containing protein [Dehalococcoidia bacterium]|nr:PDZ domain-containing protein [Dehalococcoidia bacterium]
MMSDTFFAGVITFLLVLGPLVILHELGHFLVARKFGVKVIEFGFGFPPRVGGLWTGRTEVQVNESTQFDFPEGRAGLKAGKIVTVMTASGEGGALIALLVRAHSGKADEQERIHGGQLIFGKVRETGEGRISLSEMLWSFNLLPLGGFVRMIGEEDPKSDESLASKPKGQRIAVMAAGAAVNFIIPFIIFPMILLLPQDMRVGDVILSNVLPASPAERAGLKPGDKVLKVDGRKIEDIADLQNAVTLKLGSESTWEVQKALPDPFPQPGASNYQYRASSETVKVTPRWKPPRLAIVTNVTDPDTQISLARARLYDLATGLSTSLRVSENVADSAYEISLEDAQRLSSLIQIGDVLKVVPEVKDPRHEIAFTDARKHDSALGLHTYLQQGAVGVIIETVNVKQVRRSLPPWKAVPAGLQSAYDVIVLTKNGIMAMVIGSRNPQFSGPSTVGPIGIGQLTGEVATADAGIIAKVVTLASLAGALSFSLAILNILPIPALDGGRILFVVIEWVRKGKRVSPQREGLVHLIGFVILLMFIALVSVKDILRIVRGDSLF